MMHVSRRRRSRVLALVVALVVGLGGAVVSPAPITVTMASPASAPDNSIALVPFINGFTFPVFIGHAGDGSGRLFVVEQGGKIKIVKNGQVNATPFLDVSSRIVAGDEKGLLGLAFHPKFKTNGRFFVYYTAKPPPETGNNTLAEFVVSGDPDVANPTPVRILFSLVDRAINHNGATLGFGRDGYLYVGLGDEGSSGDPFENAQDPLSLFGKMLRLDVDNGGAPLPPDYTYTIPPTNPFVGRAGFRPEIWALGFRNPYGWSFDRLTGEMLVGDVGQDAWEEIDLLPPGVGGLNFGWDDREGAHCHEPISGCLVARRTDPILEYSHAANGGPCASVTGGYRYRGSQNPSLRGTYIYGDFCTGRIWKGVFQRSGDSRPGVWTAMEALDSEHLISSFGEDEAGELYLLSFGGSSFRIVESTPPLSCSIRPNVVVQSTRIGTGTLGVTIGVSDNSTVPSNQLQSIAFTRIENAFVTIGSQIDRTAPFSTTFPSGTRSANLTVRRDRSNEPFQVVFTAADRCGPWPGFVGAGRGLP